MFKNLFVVLRCFQDTIQTDPCCLLACHVGCPPLGPHFCVPTAHSPLAYPPAQIEAVLPWACAHTPGCRAAPPSTQEPALRTWLSLLPAAQAPRCSWAALVRVSLRGVSACEALSLPARRAPAQILRFHGLLFCRLDLFSGWVVCFARGATEEQTQSKRPWGSSRKAFLWNAFSHVLPSQQQLKSLKC